MKVTVEKAFWEVFPEAQISVLVVKGLDNSVDESKDPYFKSLLDKGAKRAEDLRYHDPLRRAAGRAPQQYRAFCRVRRGGARIDRERGAGRQNREDFRRSAAEAGRDAGVIERIDHAADSDHETVFYRARGRARR